MSGIEKKIQRAKNWFGSCKRTLLSDPELARLAADFEAARRVSRDYMTSIGLVEICRRCETEAGGSCCGVGIEERYDEYLLLANLVLGVTLPARRIKDDSCFFLGPQGCTLLARHTICVNYLCKDAVDKIEQDKITLLREKEGKELELLFFLCERLRKIVKECG